MVSGEQGQKVQDRACVPYSAWVALFKAWTCCIGD